MIDVNKPEQVEVKIIESKKKKRGLLALLLLFLVVAGLIIYYFFFRPTPAPVISKDLLPPMKDAQDRSIEEIAQEVADANYFTLTINPVATFPSGTEEGDIQIVNSEANVYPISVSVTLVDTEEEVYASGGIHPNQQVLRGKLSKDLAKGEYEATATVTLYDPDTEEKQAITQASIKIIVEN